MKIPFPVTCINCGKKTKYFVHLLDTSFDFNCECGEQSNFDIQSNITLSKKILWKSLHEMETNNDFSLSIIFSAMAFEYEIARKYRKWRKVKELKKKNLISHEKLEEELRKLFNLKNKIKKTSLLMDPKGIDNFVASSKDIVKTIKKDYTFLDYKKLSKGIEQYLFRQRNCIVHLGTTKYLKDDALQCLRVSNLGIHILNLMDKTKRKEI
jgi:hypothetical protein